jgi:Rieske Fe-S protein
MPLSRRAWLSELLRASSYAAVVVTSGLGVRSAMSPRYAGGGAGKTLPGPAFENLSLRCPHLGCTVHRDREGKGFVCPCHGSRFDERGKRIAGPARGDLNRVSTEPGA